MPILNRDRWPHIEFFDESQFLEIGIKSDGAKIIQIGQEGDAPIVALAYTDEPLTEDLYPVELWSLLKFSNDEGEYQLHAQPQKLYLNAQTIFKYSVSTEDEFSLELPIDAEILSGQLQHNKFCLWVLLKPNQDRRLRRFCWIRTGDTITQTNLTYITTVQSHSHQVSHLFELKPDYRKLQQLLLAHKWQAAQDETFQILADLGGLSHDDIATIYIERVPYQDLHTVDQLWVEASKGRFGFSVQSQLWKSMGGSATTEIHNWQDELWLSFCDRLQWMRMWGELRFNLKAPQGHLPCRLAEMAMGPGPGSYPELYLKLYRRLEGYWT
jgi:hypothetical protein